MKTIFSKKRSLLILLIIFSLFAVPLWSAKAWIAELASNITFSILAGILQFVLMISMAIFELCAGIFQVVSSPAFINLPYTSQGIVAIGWPIVRDFANLGFVLVLVLIGVGTALKLNEYNFKKTLPRLIAMILLVNFTPVICGVIIDAANIIMNFFLNVVGDIPGMLLTNLSAKASSILNDLTKFLTEPVVLQIIVETTISIIFFVFAGFFLLLYAALFLTRYVAIWYLVIISPLAFMSFALSGKGGAFKKWWDQFIQWSIVGIPAAFFLYLSGQIIALSPTIISTTPTSTGEFISLSSPTNIFNSIIVYMPALVFMFIGFLASLSSGAQGADAIIATAKKWGNSAINYAKKQGVKTKDWAVERSREKIFASDTSRKFFEGMATTKNTGITGWTRRAIGLKGKSIIADVQANVEKEKNNPLLNKLLKNDDYSGIAALMENNKILNPALTMAAGAKIGDEKKDTGLDELEKIDVNRIETAIDLAKKMGMKGVVKSMVGDNARWLLKPGIIEYLFDGDKPDKAKNDLESVQNEFVEIINKMRTSGRKDLTPHEQNIAKDLMKRFGNLKDLDIETRNIDAVLSDPNRYQNKGFQAIAGYHLSRKALKGLGTEGLKKLSQNSLKDSMILDDLALYGTPEQVVAIRESHGPDVFNRIDKARHDVGFEKMAKVNPAMIYASHTGVNRQHFGHMKGPGGEMIDDENTARRFVGYTNNPAPAIPTLTAADPDLAAGKEKNGSIIGSMPVLEGAVKTNYEVYPLGVDWYIRKNLTTALGATWHPKRKDQAAIKANRGVKITDPTTAQQLKIGGSEMMISQVITPAGPVWTLTKS